MKSKIAKKTVRKGLIKKDRQLQEDCQICKVNFEVWLSSLNYSPEREEKMKERIAMRCPACKYIKK